MYFFSFPIHSPNVPLVVLCTFSAGELLSCPMPIFEDVFVLKSACVSSLSLSIDLIVLLPLNNVVLCTFSGGEFLSCSMF